MLIRPALVFAAACFAVCPSGYGQAAAPVAPTASSLVTPALEQLRASLRSVRLDKWKAPGPVRDNASGNMSSIARDLDETLPGLLTTADAAPGVVSRNLPVFRNLDALYDVLLRVVETADLAAPNDQTSSLNRALGSLESARRALGDNLEASAVSTEAQVSGLREQLRAAAAPATAAPSVVNDGAAPAVHKRKPAKAQPRPPQP